MPLYYNFILYLYSQICNSENLSNEETKNFTLKAKDEGSPPASQRVVNRISPSLIRRVPAAVKVLTIALEDLKNKKSEEIANDLRDICNAATSINALKPTVVPSEQQIKIQMMTTSHGNITKSQLSFDEISKLDTLNDNNDIVVFVNAWKSDPSNENDVLLELESAYKCRGNVSLMVIDLGSIITDVQTWMTLDYIQIGAVISKAINDFVKVSKASKLHLIGHGMGAHIAGAAGRKYAEISGNLLYRITALDPAMLCYKEPQTISGLQRGDAEFVDVIHSSAYGLGKEEPIGDVDFFPNGPSVLQPGCQNLICAHNQAIKYFAETVIPGNEKNFISEQCNSIKNLGSYTCKQNQIAMGLSVQRSAKGNYFLKTKDKSPYGFNADKTQNSNCDRL